MERLLLVFCGESTPPNKRLEVGCNCNPARGWIIEESCNPPKWNMGLEFGNSWNGIILYWAANVASDLLTSKVDEIQKKIIWIDSLIFHSIFPILILDHCVR